jgi:hypothetical protein
LKGPCQPCEHDLPTRKIKNKNQRFTPIWFYKYPCLEYSIAKDAALKKIFVCHLFKARSHRGVGGDAFVEDGYRDRKRPKVFKKHVGGVGSIHNECQEKYILFIAPTPKLIMLL